MPSMSGFSLKDHLFNRTKVEYLADLFCSADRAFPKKRFVSDVLRELPELQLKQRIALIAEKLENCLPDDFRTALGKLTSALPPPLDESKTDDDFGDFIFAPLGEYVVRNGLDKNNLKRSLLTLKEITKRFSMEDAVRAFLRKFPVETLKEMEVWVDDPNYHVRRLVSESTRPSLPWSGKIGLPVQTALPLLDKLHADPTRYVTRSVSNHLNDISKSDPDLVVATLADWQRLAKQKPSELQWMTRHGLRTLVKRGDAGSLRLLGFNPKPKVEVQEILLVQAELRPGETLEFSIELVAHRPELLVIDYEIEFVKSNGGRSGKIFKGVTLNLGKGEWAKFSKRHKLLAQATTFRLYPGEHKLTIQVNGQPTRSVSFTIR